jgi:hypothetical protein
MKTETREKIMQTKTYMFAAYLTKFRVMFGNNILTG